MKKLFTFLTVIFLLSTVTAGTALAGETISSNEEKAAVALLIKPIDRKAINELFLNEMQYIQLKNLSKQYQKDVASLTSPSLLNETPKEISLDLINTRYYKEIRTILSDYQLSIFTQQSTLATVN